MANLNNIGAHSSGTLMTLTQSGKSATSDALDNLLSDALKKPLAVTISDGAGSPTEANRTLTDDEFFGQVLFKLSGSPTVAITLQLPVAGNHLFIVKNDAGQDVTIKAAAGGAQVVIEDGQSRVLHSDGTDVLELSRRAKSYDIGFFAPVVQDGIIEGQFVVVRPFTISAGAPGSRAVSRVAGSSGDDAVVYSLRKNGVEFGTVTFLPFDADGTFAVGSDTSFVATDLVQLVSPDMGSPVTSTGLLDISITLKVEL